MPTPNPVSQIPISGADEFSSTGPSPQIVSQGTPETAIHLSGTWNIVNTVEKTSYRSFTNVRIGYRLRIVQSGANFTAEGVKLLENGQTLPTSRRTSLQVRGAVEGETIAATFVEEGIRRKTTGRFVWRLEREGTLMRGTFASTAASSSGASVATKEQ